MGRLLGERIRATVLQNSQSLREPGGPLLSEIARLIPRPGAGLTIGPYKAKPAPVMSSPLDGLSDEQLEVLTGLNAAANDIAAIQLAGHRLTSIVQLADTEAKKLGLLID